MADDLLSPKKIVYWLNSAIEKSGGKPAPEVEHDYTVPLAEHNSEAFQESMLALAKEFNEISYKSKTPVEKFTLLAKYCVADEVYGLVTELDDAQEIIELRIRLAETILHPDVVKHVGIDIGRYQSESSTGQEHPFSVQALRYTLKRFHDDLSTCFTRFCLQLNVQLVGNKSMKINDFDWRKFWRELGLVDYEQFEFKDIFHRGSRVLETVREYLHCWELDGSVFAAGVDSPARTPITGSFSLLRNPVVRAHPISLFILNSAMNRGLSSPATLFPNTACTSLLAATLSSLATMVNCDHSGDDELNEILLMYSRLWYENDKEDLEKGIVQSLTRLRTEIISEIEGTEATHFFNFFDALFLANSHLGTPNSQDILSHLRLQALSKTDRESFGSVPIVMSNTEQYRTGLLYHARIVAKNIASWCQKVKPEGFGIVTRKRRRYIDTNGVERSTYKRDRRNHIAFYDILGVETEIKSETRGRRISTMFEHQTKSREHLAAELGQLPSTLADCHERLISVSSVCRSSLLALCVSDHVLQFLRAAISYGSGFNPQNWTNLGAVVYECYTSLKDKNAIFLSEAIFEIYDLFVHDINEDRAKLIMCQSKFVEIFRDKISKCLSLQDLTIVPPDDNAEWLLLPKFPQMIER